jgi:hypothetical protein
MVEREELIKKCRGNTDCIEWLKTKANSGTDLEWITAHAIVYWVENPSPLRDTRGIEFNDFAASDMPLLVETALKKSLVVDETFLSGATERAIRKGAVINVTRLISILMSTDMDSSIRLAAVKILSLADLSESLIKDSLLEAYENESNPEIKTGMLALFSSVLKKFQPDRKKRWLDKFVDSYERTRLEGEFELALQLGHERAIEMGVVELRGSRQYPDRQMSLIRLLAGTNSEIVADDILRLAINPQTHPTVRLIAITNLEFVPYSEKIGLFLSEIVLNGERTNEDRHRALSVLVSHIKIGSSRDAERRFDGLVTAKLPASVMQLANKFIERREFERRPIRSILQRTLATTGQVKLRLDWDELGALEKAAMDNELVNTLVVLVQSEHLDLTSRENVLKVWLTGAKKLDPVVDHDILENMRSKFLSIYRGNFPGSLREESVELEAALRSRKSSEVKLVRESGKGK